MPDHVSDALFVLSHLIPGREALSVPTLLVQGLTATTWQNWDWNSSPAHCKPQALNPLAGLGCARIGFLQNNLIRDQSKGGNTSQFLLRCQYYPDAQIRQAS